MREWFMEEVTQVRKKLPEDRPFSPLNSVEIPQFLYLHFSLCFLGLPTFQHIVKVAPDPLWPLPSGRKKRNCQVFSPKDLRTFPLHAET